jgi:hypothetical protein
MKMRLLRIFVCALALLLTLIACQSIYHASFSKVNDIIPIEGAYFPKQYYKRYENNTFLSKYISRMSANVKMIDFRYEGNDKEDSLLFVTTSHNEINVLLNALYINADLTGDTFLSPIGKIRLITDDGSHEFVLCYNNYVSYSAGGVQKQSIVDTARLLRIARILKDLHDRR